MWMCGHVQAGLKMLMRDFHATMLRAAAIAGPSRADYMLRRLEGAMRFFFSRSAFTACQQIAERPETLDAARTQLVAPFPSVWLEFEGQPYAVMWAADGDNPAKGGAVVVTRHADGEINLIPFRLDLGETPYIQIPPAAIRLGEEARARGLPAYDYAALAHSDIPTQAGRLMLSAWALLATKGMTHSVTVPVEKLNRQRAARGLHPLLSYQEVRLDLSVERAIKAKHGAGTGQMPLHAVRAHLRLLPTGRVTIVRAHMRGSHTHGIRGHYYTVTCAEGEPE